MSPRPVPFYEPFDELVEGDVIYWGQHGRLRKVRNISRGPDDALQFVAFAILRPSWTGRPYTVYTRSDVRLHFRGVALKGTPLCDSDPLECRVQQEINEPDCRKRFVFAREMFGAVL